MEEEVTAFIKQQKMSIRRSCCYLEAVMVAMPIDAFVEEMANIPGDFTVTMSHAGGAHTHMSHPLPASDRRGLREECEDAVGNFGFVVRRYAKDAVGHTIMYVRNYFVAVKCGLAGDTVVARLPPAYVAYSLKPPIPDEYYE